MPDKRAGSWRGMWPGRDVAAYAKSVFSTHFSFTFTFLFSQHSRLLSSKERELATQFSFLCMSRTVSGSNSWSFVIIRDHSFGSLTARLAKDWRYRRSQIFQALLPFFFFFACFVIFLKKVFSERKLALEKFPKKDEGALQITVHDQSMTKATFETVGQVRKAIFTCFDHRLKKCLYLYFLALFYFLHALLMAMIAYRCLKKYQGVT